MPTCSNWFPGTSAPASPDPEPTTPQGRVDPGFPQPSQRRVSRHVLRAPPGRTRPFPIAGSGRDIGSTAGPPPAASREPASSGRRSGQLHPPNNAPIPRSGTRSCRTMRSFPPASSRAPIGERSGEVGARPTAQLVAARGPGHHFPGVRTGGPRPFVGPDVDKTASKRPLTRPPMSHIYSQYFPTCWHGRF